MPGASRLSPGRRRFVQLLGWASVLAAGGGPALAQVAARRSKSSPKPPPSPAPLAGHSPELSGEARALTEVVKQRYGEHLSPQDLETIARDLDGDVRAMKRLKEVKLANADEPDVTFHA